MKTSSFAIAALLGYSQAVQFIVDIDENKV
jgi:hypothetical protein